MEGGSPHNFHLLRFDPNFQEDIACQKLMR